MSLKKVVTFCCNLVTKNERLQDDSGLDRNEHNLLNTNGMRTPDYSG